MQDNCFDVVCALLQGTGEVHTSTFSCPVIQQPVYKLSVTALHQLEKRMILLPLVYKLVTRLFKSTGLLQVVPRTCYCPSIQQFVSKLCLIALWQLEKRIILLPLVYKLATRLLKSTIKELVIIFQFKSLLASCE